MDEAQEKDGANRFKGKGSNIKQLSESDEFMDLSNLQNISDLN